MIRKFKALGLALVAVLAMGALAAQGAAAHEFRSEAEATDLTGSGSNHEFKVGGFTITCSSAAFSGTATGKEADHVRVHPTYNNTENTCTTSLGKATVHTDGCDYTFDSETDGNGHAQTSVVCEGTSKITITGPGCTISVGSQTPTGGVSFTNEGSGTTADVKVTATVTGITATGASTFGCAIAGLSGHLTGGTYTGTTTVKGYKDPSAHGTADHVGISVS